VYLAPDDFPIVRPLLFTSILQIKRYQAWHLCQTSIHPKARTKIHTKRSMSLEKNSSRFMALSDRTVGENMNRVNQNPTFGTHPTRSAYQDTSLILSLLLIVSRLGVFNSSSWLVQMPLVKLVSQPATDNAYLCI
jgi:hypothetical protein